MRRRCRGITPDKALIFGTACGNNYKGFKDFELKAEARIWPCLSYVRHILSTAEKLEELHAVAMEGECDAVGESTLQTWL